MTWKNKINSTNAYYLRFSDYHTKMETKRGKIIMEQQHDTLEQHND
jgi:hypothetical protein